MQERSNRFMKTGLITLLVLGSAVAAFGLTFHFFGQSEIVPAPSKQFGFFALAPLGIIDKIYFWYSHERLYWHPIPMFLCLWITYSLLSTFIVWLFIRKKIL
jgi:hypothetical protein